MTINKKIKQSLLSKHFLGIVSSWLVILIIGGYNLVALLAVNFKLPSTPLSIGYRAIYMTISMVLLFIYVLKRKFTLTIGNYLFLGFWIIYIGRLIYDLSIANIPLYRNLGPNYFYLYAIGGCFIPAFAVACTGKYINIQYLIKNLFYFLLINHILLTLYMITSGGGNIFLKRAALSAASEGENTLGPLMISLNGSFLFVLSIVSLFFGKAYKICKKNTSIFGLILGISAVFLGASRGPLIFSLFIMMVIIFYNHKYQKKNIFYLLKASFVTFFLIFTTIYIIIPSVNWEEVNMISRLEMTTQKGRKEVRVDYYIIAWNDFISNPILGKHFLINVHGIGGIVHNIYLEVLQATGIIGGLFFYGMLMSLIKNIYQYYHRYSIVIFVISLLLVVLGFAMTSGAIYTDPYFWVLITLTLSLTTPKRNLKNN